MISPRRLATRTSLRRLCGTPYFINGIDWKSTWYRHTASRPRKLPNGWLQLSKCWSPGTFSTNTKSGRHASTRSANRSNSGTRSSSATLGCVVFCLVKGWHGAHPEKRTGLDPAASTRLWTCSAPTARISANSKWTSGKFAVYVRLASWSQSRAKTTSNPADWKPQLVPPQPEKKSKTLIFIDFGRFRALPETIFGWLASSVAWAVNHIAYPRILPLPVPGVASHSEMTLVLDTRRA